MKALYCSLKLSQAERDPSGRPRFDTVKPCLTDDPQYEDKTCDCPEYPTITAPNTGWDRVPEVLNSTVPNGGRYLTSSEVKSLRRLIWGSVPNDILAMPAGSPHYAHLYHKGSCFGYKVTTK